jgi:hypothetical protein
MADEPKPAEIDEEPAPSEEQQPPAPNPGEEDDSGVNDEGEEILTFGDSDEETQDTDNATIRHLRSRLRDVQKENSELRRAAPQPQAIEAGPKPTLESCDWDEEKFEAELVAWNNRKAEADRQATAQARAAEEQRKALETRITRFTEQKAAIGKSDVDEAMETVKVALGEAKFVGIVGLLDDTTDAAKFMYALAGSPANLEALSNQTDAIQLVKQVTKLEGQLKMVRHRKAPEPDVPEKGSGKVSTIPGGTQKKLAQLKAKAEESGDYTEYFTFKRQVEGK